LAPEGWDHLLRHHGLDLRAKELRAELLRPLSTIDRTAPGFEDFAAEGERAIEPGNPARSMLFHAFASPHVKTLADGQALTAFPTAAEIEAVENFVYGAEPPTVEDLRGRARDAHLAVVVFSVEYRPAVGTVHRRHADLCFSRTGVARIGTMPAKYDDQARGYLPFADEPAGIRVLPCRYAAYVAALAPGDKFTHGPMRFIEAKHLPLNPTTPRKDAGLRDSPSATINTVADLQRNFWVPLHKLFDGEHCIRGYRIEVRLSANHINEKIRRAHLRFLAAGHFGGWTEPDLSNAPFIIHDGIAELISDGGWLLQPVPHSKLIEAAEYAGKPLTFWVPESAAGRPWRTYRSSLNLLPEASGARSAPEYLHARHVIAEDGSHLDLNASPEVVKAVTDGGYRAQHYVDFTGDGSIGVECSALALDIPRRLPAYSIVASPDFFPRVSQTDLMQWTDQSVPRAMTELLWPVSSGPPQALSDQRFAANLELSNAGFDPHDDTMTAIVGHFGSGNSRLTHLKPLDPTNQRASALPDAAAGVFAPGWDVSYGRSAETEGTNQVASGITFLNNYGLGSPFVEDAMLCAALSSFWPAVAPDTTRTFAPSATYVATTPLTDDAIGLSGAEPWDGIAPPVLSDNGKTVEYTALVYGDYVNSALQQKFRLARIGSVETRDYFTRTLTMALVYEALGVTNHEQKLVWSVLSFKRPDTSDQDLLDALAATKRKLSPEHVYRYVMYRHVRNGARPHPTRFDRLLVDVQETVLLFADPSTVLKKTADGWEVHELGR
jgi:hypothetical protein